MLNDRSRITEREMIRECFIHRLNLTLDYQNIDLVRKKLEKTLEQYPESYSAFLYLGLSEIEKNPVNANYYFDKALMLKPDLEQGWYYKGLIHLSHHEFKAALNCFKKVLNTNSKNYRAQNFKLDILFYQKEFKELDKYYLELFKQRLNDNDFLLNEMVSSKEGMIFGVVDDVRDNMVLIRKSIVFTLEDYLNLNNLYLTISKDKIMTLGEMIMLDISCKFDLISVFPVNPEPPLVIDNYGFYLGELKAKQGDLLIIDIRKSSEIRYFSLLNQNIIKLPKSGIISHKKGVLIYDVKELDPKDILKNSDPSAFLRRVFKYSDPFNSYLTMFNSEAKNPHPVKYYGL
jgi:tetratricopeptide (TPR) repeat protein